MFFAPNIKKTAFIKLFYYYCRKLRRNLWGSIFLLVYILILIVIQLLLAIYLGMKGDKSKSSWEKTGQSKKIFFDNERLKILNENLLKYGGFITYLLVFWVISFLQAAFIFTAVSPLVLVLNGVSYSQHLKKAVNWKEQMKALMGKGKKIINADDITVLALMPGVKLETMVLAKFAAVMFFAAIINFVFLTLPLSCVLIFCSLSLENFSWLWLPVFLVINSIFSVLDCWPWVAGAFASHEGGVRIVGIASYFLWIIFIKAVVLITIAAKAAPKLSGIIWAVPLLILLYFPLMFGNGYYFFNFYREKFLTRDLV